MFENMTFDYIMERLLSRVPNDIDKREGSIIWDALSPAALEIETIYIGLDMVLNEGFADTASWYYLLKRAAERGVFPKDESKAILKGEFYPSTVEIPIGHMFNLGTLNYEVIQKIMPGIYQLQCTSSGIIGNTQFGSLVPVEHIEGLENANLTELITPGEDIEETEHFRNKYFSSFDSQAFGGNRADYREKINKIAGVGGCKPLRRKAGEKEIKIVIIASNFTPPSTDLILQVQEVIDPYENQEGDGLAPIGHIVKILGVEQIKISVSTSIIFKTDFYYDNMQTEIENTIDSYFKELTESWENADELIIRVLQIESRLIQLNGILDIKDTKINGSTANLILSETQIPVRGDLFVN